MSMSCLLVTSVQNKIEITTPFPQGDRLPAVDLYAPTYRPHPSLIGFPDSGHEQLIEQALQNRNGVPATSINLSDNQMDLGADIYFPTIDSLSTTTALAHLAYPTGPLDLVSYAFRRNFPSTLEKIYLSATAFPHMRVPMCLTDDLNVGAFIVLQNWEAVHQNPTIHSMFLSYLDLFIFQRDSNLLQEFLYQHLLPSRLQSAVFVAAVHPKNLLPDFGKIPSA